MLGLSTVFLILGFAASALGKLFLSYQDALNTIAGLLVMGFGLHFLGIVRIGLLEREARFEASSRNGSAFGAYVLGLAFAFGWTPCIGPVLGSILALSATEASISKGILLLSFYSFVDWVLELRDQFIIPHTFSESAKITDKDIE